MVETAGGVHQGCRGGARGGQGQGDGVDCVVPALQVCFQVFAFLTGQVEAPAPQHQPGDAALRIQHHAGAAMVPGQLAGQG